MPSQELDTAPIRVLFVDDAAEKSGTRAHEYATLLGEDNRFDLKLLTSFTGADKHIRDSGSREDFVLLDMILPVDEVSVGLSSRTAGLVLLEDGMRTRGSRYLRVPVLVVTNDNEDDVRKSLEDYDRVWVRHKAPFEPFMLIEELHRIKRLCTRTD